VESIPDISELPPSTLNAAVAVGVAFGALYCFLGYRTLRFIMGVTGFGLAGGVAFVITAWLTQGHTISALVAGGLGGVCGALQAGEQAWLFGGGHGRGQERVGGVFGAGRAA